LLPAEAFLNMFAMEFRQAYNAQSRHEPAQGWTALILAGDRPRARWMSQDYKHGQRDGLRMALAVLAAEEAKWAALLGESASWRTNAIREVRHKTLQVAQTRIRTVLNRLTPKEETGMDEELAAAIAAAGL
jgi:hypothetical protein